MKSVLRSAFDPIPRPLSPGAQLLVVGVLIVGIAISVVEYVESSRPATLAEEVHASPARSESRPESLAPADAVARPRNLVRVAPARNQPAAVPGSSATGHPAPGSEPGATRGAPMLLQPEEGG
jgi:hypothetical protein